jgi:hypothetical protein
MRSFMKTYLFLILSFFSITCFAENWLNDSKIIAGSKEAHSLQKDCERISKEKCYELGNYPSSVYSRGLIEVDDYAKPNYTKSQIEPCGDQAECDLIFASKTCPSDRNLIKNYDLLQVYCSKFMGYEKKSEPTITLDTQKLQAFQAQNALELLSKQKEAGLQVALRKIDCGKRVIALLVLRNSSKVLSTSQISQINNSYAGIKGLLETASLNTAKEAILATVPDGVMITEGDIADLANETQKCIDI